MDPWYSLGKADMLDVAADGAPCRAAFEPSRIWRWCFDAVTVNSAEIMGLEGYGLAKGNKANLVILQACDPIEAIRLRATRLFVVRAGKVIAETPAAVANLSLPGRPESFDPGA